MNKYKKTGRSGSKQNLNIFSTVLSMNSYGYLFLVEKKKNNVLVSPGGVSLFEFMSRFSEKEKIALFKRTMFSYFNKGNHCLHNVSDSWISYLYDEILSDKIKEYAPKFNAMIECLEETGKLFYDDLQLLHHEKVGNHEKYFFEGGKYIFFNITGNNMEPVVAEEDGPDMHPADGRDFFCQDGDILKSHISIDVRELLDSFRDDTSLSKRYSRGAHRVALAKLLERSDFLKKEYNKDLVYLLEFVK